MFLTCPGKNAGIPPSFEFLVSVFFVLPFSANSRVCWLGYFVFPLVFIAVGLAWPNNLAVFATFISVSL